MRHSKTTRVVSMVLYHPLFSLFSLILTENIITYRHYVNSAMVIDEFSKDYRHCF